MSRRLSVLLIWSCVAASAVFWSFRLLAQPSPVPQSARLASTEPVQNADWSRLLGAAARPEVAAVAVTAAASRFRLVGVAATGLGLGLGPAIEVALIAVDGMPPRAFRIGQRVVDSFLLSDVSRHGATLAAGTAAAEKVVLEMPLPTAAATGSLGQPQPQPQPPAMPVVGSSVSAAPAAPPVAPAVVATPGEGSAPPQAPELRNSPLAR